MRILITGASGFVGQALIRNCPTDWNLKLLQHRTPVEHPEAEIVQGDLENPKDCSLACQGVDAVIHAAGGTGSAAVTASSAMDGIVSNLILTSRILQAAWSTGVKKVLIFGSTTGYPEGSSRIREEDMWNGEPPPDYLGYGWMRRYLEKMGQFVSQKSPTEVISLRPAAVYGPGDRSSHVIPSLLQKAQQAQDPFEVWGSGSEERDFLYIDDLAEACYLALRRLRPDQPVHLASGQVHTVTELTEEILSVSGHRPRQIRYLKDKPTNVSSRRFDLSRANQVLGFQARVSLREGLERTWRWLQGEGVSNPRPKDQNVRKNAFGE